MDYAPSLLTRMTAEIYRGKLGLRPHVWAITVLRPWYGIYNETYKWIPPGSRVLDIGCGGGGFLLLAHRLLQLGSSIGYDINESAIQLARSAGKGTGVRFDVSANVPASVVAQAEVITLNDVLHHLESVRRDELIEQLTNELAPGARLIIKDLDPKPAWRAMANRITDFLSTGSRVSYISLDELVDRLRAKGFTVLEKKRVLKHVWSQYLLVVERPSSSGFRIPN